MAGWDDMVAQVGRTAVRTFGVDGGAVLTYGDTSGEVSLTDAIFDRRHEEAVDQEGLPMNIEPIKLGVHFEDLPREPVQDRDFVTVRSTEYVIRDVQRDSGNLYTLILQERAIP